jgi:hypothetical protein
VASGSARTGAAGAFYTAALLALHGWDASLTVGNTPRTDIVAQHHDHQTLIAVQCKATTGNKTYLLSSGCESPSPPSRNEWFVLVALRGAAARPDFFIVPRNVAAAYIYVGHQAWLTVPAKNGKPHRPNSMRDVEQEAVKHYKERWDLLDQPVETVPYWLPDWVFDWEAHTGLPVGHPGLVRPTDGVMTDEDRAWAAGWTPPAPGPTRASTS